VLSMVWTLDGKFLVTGNEDGIVRLHDPNTLKTVRELRGHGGAVNAVAVDPRGGRLASAGSSVRLWDLSTGKQGPVLHGHAGRIMSLAFGPDGRQLATASFDGTVKVWDLPNWPVEVKKE
jgi:WD40 repeat protein